MRSHFSSSKNHIRFYRFIAQVSPLVMGLGGSARSMALEISPVVSQAISTQIAQDFSPPDDWSGSGRREGGDSSWLIS